MYLLFVDESGEPGGRSFTLGGAAIRMDDWHVVHERWEALRTASSWPPDREIKWHRIKIGDVPPAMADALFDMLAGAPMTCFAVVIKPLAARKASPEHFGSDEDVYAEALTYLAERYQRFLARADAYGSIVLDSRNTELDERLRRFFEALRRDGTPYLGLERIVDALLLGPSHHSLGLQVADLVAGVARGQDEGQGDASRWFKALRPRFATHPDTGALEGVGLVRYPRRVRAEPPPRVKLFTTRPR